MERFSSVHAFLIITLALVYWTSARPTFEDNNNNSEESLAESSPATGHTSHHWSLASLSGPADQALDAFGVPIECVVRDFNFSATVTDRNGRKCRGLVQTKACFGSCESYEVGTFQFPWVVRVQPVCNYAEIITRVVRLRDCEPGADRNAAFYRFPEAKSCSCQTCDKRNNICQPATTSTTAATTTTTSPPENADYENIQQQRSVSSSSSSSTEDGGEQVNQRERNNDYSNDQPSFPAADHHHYSTLLGMIISPDRRVRKIYFK